MLFKTTAAFLALTVAALGHMQINYPCPRYSPHCATTPALPAGESVDYNLANPIGSNGTVLAPLCHYTTPWPTNVATWTAGQTVTVQFYPSGATHTGGHCEFSISYDGGKTFVVLHQELQYCFYTAPPSAGGVNTVRSYTFTLPSNLPGSDHALFAWSWVNASGNREFYNDCADITIVGAAGSYTGKQMTIANYGPGYPAIPEFLGNYNTGLEYYTSNTTSVTVTGPGSTGGGSGTTTTSAVATTTTSAAPSTTTTIAPTSSAPKTTTATSAPPTTTTTSAAPTTTSGSGSCTSGNYQCTSDKSSFQICDNGVWTVPISCGSGLSCVQSGASIYCS
ncbi:hypothetical protein DL89DRAFT_65749 [Linderina pennispora]|uniref:Chitin-binding type-4 domain-containing protein n=1 Tax=Linderina pennispora TaxID=61395 RepID=A0A1Y1W0J7_9FUNG|nr:uncharacterized protein DL89DRAFT_65749 [Linderina pennispora]ORX66634.1 hypothetical protein DL89DRAFT_65749 [Linderina pennispora]